MKKLPIIALTTLIGLAGLTEKPPPEHFFSEDASILIYLRN